MIGRTLTGTIAPVIAGALLLVACGDDGTAGAGTLGGGAVGGAGGGSTSDASVGGTGAGTKLIVEAHDIDFDRDAYRIAAGPVQVDYVQKGRVPHSLVVEAASGGDIDGFRLEVGEVDADHGTLDLSPGSYVFFCDVPGHRAAGMEAGLEVD